jgi:hypothetical protein
LWIRELDLQSVSDPNRAEELETLKTEIRASPDDEQLLSRIRQLDLEVKQDKIRRLDLQFRQDKIRRRDFSRKGSYLLLGSVVVCRRRSCAGTSLTSRSAKRCGLDGRLPAVWRY